VFTPRKSAKKATEYSVVRYGTSYEDGVARKARVYLGLGLPREVSVDMEYVDLIALGTNPGINYYFRSSLYDPDISGTGHQPRFFDQLCSPTMYNYYKVSHMWCEVTFVNLSSSVTCQVQTWEGAATGSSVITGTETQNAQSTMLTIASGSASKVTMKRLIDVKAVLGTDLFNNTNNTAALYNANPQSVAYWGIGAWDVAAGSAVDVRCHVKIRYRAVLSYRADPGQS